MKLKKQLIATVHLPMSVTICCTQNDGHTMIVGGNFLQLVRNVRVGKRA